MKWLAKQLVLSFIKNWPVIWRANLYFWGSFIVALSEKLCAILFNDVWPSLPYAIGSFLAAFGVALIALRAYYDGSSQRHTDEHANDAAKIVTKTEVQQTTVETKPAPTEPPKTP